MVLLTGMKRSDEMRKALMAAFVEANKKGRVMDDQGISEALRFDSRYCAKKGCEETERSVAGQTERAVKLMYCGQCKRVSYCCKLHQKQDWNAQDDQGVLVGHKQVCKLLQQYVGRSFVCLGCTCD